MTVQGLLTLILLGIFVQLAIYASVAYFRYWLAYQALKRRTGSEAVAETDGPSPADPGDTGESPAWAGHREFRVSRREVEDAAGNICSFYLEPTDGKPLAAFRPGQYLTFALDVDDPAGGMKKSIVRCYSLSDAPAPDHFRVSIKRVPAAAAGLPAGLSSNHFHDRVRVGDCLQVKAPGGHFFLDPGGAGPIVLLAGGIGLTPLYSMLAATLAARPEREVWLFLGVRDGREVPFRRPLHDLAVRHPNFHLRLCFSQPAPGEVPGHDYHHAGRVDAALLRMSLGLKPYHFYLCGPGPMMESLVSALEDWGVPGERIHFEAFGPATVRHRSQANPAGPALDVTFARSGRTLRWDGGAASLLELAEAHQVRVESGCRAGCCGACQTTIESGAVAYAQPPEFDVAPGSCLLCLAKPTTDLVLAA